MRPHSTNPGSTPRKRKNSWKTPRISRLLWSLSLQGILSFCLSVNLSVNDCLFNCFVIHPPVCCVLTFTYCIIIFIAIYRTHCTCLLHVDVMGVLFFLWDRFKLALQQNEIMDVFYIDWLHLGDADGNFGNKSDNHLKVMPPF